ncbi:hypothetical protein Cgig2_018946 [Carnegiea gigantea]|uniref:CCHC-type domain-containing protein n=1 Tax=Carnegiea gigantea TaxID=171969 RepID=A0A9Q1JJG1_9CARY|nr:hypothetical protein Cgig2_018946 [Carnegiea gigantea]
MIEFSVSASTTKGHNPQIPPRVAPQGTSSRTSRNPVQCFSCRGRGHYASECPHRTRALEHESFGSPELEEKVVDPEGDLEDLVDVENSLLHDAHLGIGRCLLANPVMNDECKRSTLEELLQVEVLDNLPHDVIYAENQVSPWKEVWVEKRPDNFCRTSLQ